jgi:WhiB family redox-sensing transcriptional regulator
MTESFSRHLGSDPERLSYPPKDESWRSAANCLGLDGALFFPGRGQAGNAARAVCARCTVRAACLQYALTPPVEAWGIWGGTSERERRTLRMERRRA